MGRPLRGRRHGHHPNAPVFDIILLGVLVAVAVGQEVGWRPDIVDVRVALALKASMGSASRPATSKALQRQADFIMLPDFNRVRVGNQVTKGEARPCCHLGHSQNPEPQAPFNFRTGAKIETAVRKRISKLHRPRGRPGTASPKQPTPLF
jgi:hypothetical protein